MTKKRTLAIVGIGPRGLNALENFLIEVKKQSSSINLLLFEETGNYGYGHVYDINQVESNWININERILTLNGRDEIEFDSTIISAFPSYHEWIDRNYNELPKNEIDTYPPRAKIGKYLDLRFQSLINPLLKTKMVSLFNEKIKYVELNNDKVRIKTNSNTFENIDELLLTIGHQPTKLSKQIIEWDKYFVNNKQVKLFKSPYPISDFLNSKDLTPESVVGIRGFGLAMIDVVRGIANKFGKFVINNNTTKSCKYYSEHDITNMLIPFSLDGLPPAPKPLNAEIDEWFKPTNKEIITFEENIQDLDIQRKAKSPQFLINAITPIIARVYSKLPKAYLGEQFTVKDIEKIAQNWLEDYKYEHAIITSRKLSTKKMMQNFVGMATGKEAINLDFCIGQVWRHCQPSIYDKLSFNECSDEVFAEIIKLDESLKRYSYGPPVESIQQMLALTSAGVMTLDMVNDPEIELNNKGWFFKSNGETRTANIMIDSVLDSPKIESVNSPIVKSLLENDLIEAVHDGLGVYTDENGYVISNDMNKKIPIALLGRLAKGTIIGVDAILECFGDRPKAWAIEAANRHSNWLTSNQN
ncbi:FAD/NAD(P)-binding protein [Flaviramulus sp. BrNp1-15]|uniref:FAD/NAD(P)-binding protein n=1 Tax=Flaviramulus sp. BrNp1-15 TaxID=2916754 RepID=UPI001EE93EDA|nr:FAD/NAD(P)-binding protein [Flaviramulus sp. BrNp1-15]ULC58652.1 FAD/NAD(P)-binding protein [Flaviramulus sp. BrNp1-15]